MDFFIDNYPIDLKVTYFPNEFMEKKLKDKIGNKELAWLKKEAKSQYNPDKVYLTLNSSHSLKKNLKTTAIQTSLRCLRNINKRLLTRHANIQKN